MQEGGAEIASVTSAKNRIGRNDNLRAAFSVPPVSAGIVKGCSGFGIRSISMLGAYVKVLRPNTQYHPTLILEHSILRPPDCDNSANLDVSAQPVLDRFFGLFLVRQRRLALSRVAKDGPFAWHSG